jgi:hypothetical protein
MMTFLGLTPIEPTTHRQAAVTALLLVIALVVLATLGRLLRPFAGRRGSDPTPGVCGHCGYSLRGLPSTVCPECGSDTAVVGVRRPSHNRGSGRWILCALWIVLVLVFNSNFDWEIESYFLRLVWGAKYASRSNMLHELPKDPKLLRQLLIAALIAGGVTIILLASRKPRWRPAADEYRD